ncbi:MAG: hypothetical protein KDE58_06700 [Caldilineaceae bacterium]|nr:hypothetical protein [Caldilineaceae bacterium]
MELTLTPDVENALSTQALLQGTTPEQLALDTLREKFVVKEREETEFRKETEGEFQETLLDFLGEFVGVLHSGSMGEKPYVITINAISGGGKTALASLVAESLPQSQLFCFDDFDETNCYPDDFYAWYQRGADPLEIDCPGMGDAVTQAIAQGTSRYLVLDCPLARDHPRFATIIDLAVFIDTPLDVALARRILRDYTTVFDVNAAVQMEMLRDSLLHYLRKARYPYLEAAKRKATCDLVLDGWQDLIVLRDQLLRFIQKNHLASTG